MKIIKCLFYFTVISLCLCYTTYDDDFEKNFKVTHIIKGDDKTYPNPGDEVVVDYKGILADGTQFDSSYDRKVPFKFNVKIGQVIPCWDQAVSRMSTGEKIKITCPFETAYGKNGMGEIIPS